MCFCSGNEGCSFIAYDNGPGYINTTDQPYMGFSGVKSYGQCCHLCAADSTCTHFTATSSGSLFWKCSQLAAFYALMIILTAVPERHYGLCTGYCLAQLL